MNTNKLSIFALSILSALIPISASAVSSQSLTLSPNPIELGNVDATKGVVKQDLKIQNNSDEVVTIKDIKTSCGCTTSELKKNVLNPGEETTLEVSFNPTGITGNVTRLITVFLEGTTETIRVPLKANVNPYGSWILSPKPPFQLPVDGDFKFTMVNPDSDPIYPPSVTNISVFPSSLNLKTEVMSSTPGIIEIGINTKEVVLSSNRTKAMMRLSFSGGIAPVTIPLELDNLTVASLTPSTVFLKQGVIEEASITLVQQVPTNPEIETPLYLAAKPTLRNEIVGSSSNQVIKISVPNWDKVPFETGASQRQDIVKVKVNGKVLTLNVILNK